VLVVSQDLDELAEIADRIAVMFHGRLSAPLNAAEATREKLGLLMGGAGAAGQAGEHGGEACSWCLKSAPSAPRRLRSPRR
jgi:energy-coupling factor transporter ATP-binding protein EcfA2